MLEFLRNGQKGKKDEKAGEEGAFPGGGDALSILKSQHREIEELFVRVENAEGRDVNKVFADLAARIQVHSRIEEKIFYPEAADVDSDAVLRANEEHAIVKDLLKKLERRNASVDIFRARIAVLKELIEHHVEEEENELFPKCEKELGDEALSELGARIQAMMTRGERSTPKRKVAATRKAAPAKGKTKSRAKKPPATRSKSKAKKRSR